MTASIIGITRDLQDELLEQKRLYQIKFFSLVSVAFVMVFLLITALRDGLVANHDVLVAQESCSKAAKPYQNSSTL